METQALIRHTCPDDGSRVSFKTGYGRGHLKAGVVGNLTKKQSVTLWFSVSFNEGPQGGTGWVWAEHSLVLDSENIT